MYTNAIMCVNLIQIWGCAKQSQVRTIQAFQVGTQPINPTHRLKIIYSRDLLN